MDPASRRQAVARHRSSLRKRGLVRLEVRARAEDAQLLREVAEALASGEQGGAMRLFLRDRLAASRPSGLKALLASAPFDDIDLDRPRDLGREIDL